MKDSRTGTGRRKAAGSRAIGTRARGPAFVVPALAAIGIGSQAVALELGPVRMESTLGEPLRASIALALRAHEQVASYCVRVATGRSPSGLPSPGPTWVSVRDGTIHVQGERPVADPLIGLELTVDCPYAPHLSREYVVFVDPPRAEPAPVARVPAPRAEEPVPATAPAARVRARQADSSAPAARIRTAGAESPAPVAGEDTYRVRRGDTLSGIAARLPGRRLGIWETADRLFAANPQAFIDGNPDRLRAGAVLRIPGDVFAVPASSAASVSATAAVTSVPDAAPPSAAGAATRAAPAPVAAAVEPAFDASSSAPDAAAPVPVARTEAEDASPAAEDAIPLEDIFIDADGLFVPPVDAEDLGAPLTAMPEVGGADGLPVDAVPGGTGRYWLFGFLGTGVALLLGLLLFGRQLKERFGGGRRLVFNVPGLDAEPAAPDADAEHDPAALKVDFRFDEGEADARIVRVDADLDDGTGFRETGDIDVAQDFGFAASGGMELGLDIDFSAAPARPREGEVIVEEFPAGEPTANTEYDLSMIVDATRQTLDDDEDTEKDLHAIQVEDAGGESEEDPFTLSRELDYRILEQDYEEELTATQALAKELADAARELVGDPGDTRQQSLHELPTVEMPGPRGGATDGSREDATGEDDTDLLPAAAMEDGSGTDVNEHIAELPDAGNDTTAALEIESATVDTKKLKVS